MAVQPLFDFTPAEREEGDGPFLDDDAPKKGGKFKLQARGEGSRTRYDPRRAGRVRLPRPQERPRSSGGGRITVQFPSGPGVVHVGRRGGPVAGRTVERNGRRFKVVKRRRKPDPELTHRNSVIDYQGRDSMNCLLCFVSWLQKCYEFGLGMTQSLTLKKELCACFKHFC